MSQCKALSAVLGDRISYPQDSVYTQSVESYWSQQQENLTPECVVTPRSSGEVAVAIKTLCAMRTSTKLGSSFAVRGGGHTPFPGSSNIESGVPIDLRALKTVEIGPDQSVTSIGGGAIWRDVYQTPIPKNLMVSGGRASDVGVGGLTLGGKLHIQAWLTTNH